MKRIFKSLPVLACIVAGLLASCTQTEMQEKESVSIDGLESDYGFPAVPAGDMTFEITSNVAWSISVEDLDWLTVAPSRGIGDGKQVTVTVSPSANETLESREGHMTVTAGSVTSKVRFFQGAATLEPEFNVKGVEGDTFYVEALDVEGATFSVSSNRDWKATLDKVEWADVTPLQGEKNRSATISVIPKSQNDDEQREGTVSFDYGAASPKVIRLVHKKFVPEIQLSVETLQTGRAGIFVNPVVTVSSNASWTAECSADWIALSAEEGSLGDTEVMIYCKVNDTGESRTAEVTFVNNGVTAVLTVNQSNDFIEVSVETLSVSKQSAAFDIRSNVAWTITSSEPWVSLSPTEGTGDASVSVTLEPLPEGESKRTARITVSSAVSEELSATIALEQTPPLQIEYIDLYETPVLFLSNRQADNVMNNPDFATSGQTGSQAAGGTGKGTGRLRSYSHLANDAVYMQYTTPNNFGPLYVLSSEGNITIKNAWNDDAFEFHIPVRSLSAGHVLNFEYGIYGTNGAPGYWHSEVSLDGGLTWEALNTGTTVSTPVLKVESNSPSSGKSRQEAYYAAKYILPVAVEESEILVRVRCAEANTTIRGETITSASSSAAIRLIGGAGHVVTDDATSSEFKGPRIYATTDVGVVIPELKLSPASLSASGTSVTFNVTSNVSWTAVASESWATVSPAEGTGNATLTVSLAELEPGAENRTVTVTITAVDGSVSGTVAIEQIAPPESGAEGNYIDLAKTPVEFNTYDYQWNMTNNPDYASKGETGGGKVEGEGTGKGTGKVQSFSHYTNPDCYLQIETSERASGHNPAVYVMPEHGITARYLWTDDAYVVHLPVWKMEAGQTLCFDFTLYCNGATSPRYYSVEASFDGGESWKLFNTGENRSYTTVNDIPANLDLEKQSAYIQTQARCAVEKAIERQEVLVRIRVVDGTHTVSTKAQPHGTAPGSGTIRLLGLEQLSVKNAYAGEGPKIYVQ